jgi:hypothetical protein
LPQRAEARQHGNRKQTQGAGWLTKRDVGVRVRVCDFVECPGNAKAPDFYIPFFSSKWRYSSVLEAVQQSNSCNTAVSGTFTASGPTDTESGFISSSTFYYWCFLERKVEASKKIVTT